MIKEFEENYFVDENGNVYKKLKPYTSANYKYIKANGKHRAIHRLVGEYFVDNPNNENVINHIDGDKTNNNKDNLEWCSQLDNVRHYLNNGGSAVRHKVNCKLYNEEELVGEYESIREACRVAKKLGAKYSMLNKYGHHRGFRIVKG